MAWTTPITFVANDPLMANQLNLMLRDNMNELAVAQATQPGQVMSTFRQATSVLPSQAVWGYEGTEISIQSEGAGNTVSRVGPFLQIPPCRSLWTMLMVRMRSSAGAAAASINRTLEGQSTGNLFTVLRTASPQSVRFGGTRMVPGLANPGGGLNVYLEHVGTSGTATFAHRLLIAIPLGPRLWYGQHPRFGNHRRQSLLLI